MHLGACIYAGKEKIQASSVRSSKDFNGMKQYTGILNIYTFLRLQAISILRNLKLTCIE